MIDLDRWERRVFIFGSRPPKDARERSLWDEHWQRMAWIGEVVHSLSADALVISGGARGADGMAKQYAQGRALAFLEIEPIKRDGIWKIRLSFYSEGCAWTPSEAWWDERTFPSFPATAYARNGIMVDYCTDAYGAWDGMSKGTRNSIDLAKRAGKLREVFTGTTESTPDALFS